MIKTLADLDPVTDPKLVQDIHDWALRADLARPALLGLKICPYARSALGQVLLARLPYPELFILQEDFTMIIFLASADITLEDLQAYARRLGSLNPELIFLTDHQSFPTFMNGEQTDNTRHNIILCQPRHKLESAREKMKKTAYFSLWSEEEFRNVLRARGVDLN